MRNTLLLTGSISSTCLPITGTGMRGMIDRCMGKKKNSAGSFIWFSFVLPCGCFSLSIPCTSILPPKSPALCSHRDPHPGSRRTYSSNRQQDCFQKRRVLLFGRSISQMRISIYHVYPLRCHDYITAVDNNLFCFRRF